MSYRVFARKYRPQTFEEVVGQEHITKTLQNAIREDRVAQAYMFVGPRGIGKTSSARILAKALNCAEGPTPNPCGKCDACREISEGRSLDVLEIDGASNNGVDNIRDLRDNAAYAPATGKYKIYLIDEVHMLSAGAFNALLKTLEEPPSHVKFIFATTEAQKVPATITSRCQRFDLRRIPADAIAGHLGKIADAEGIRLESGASAAIARAAEGGLRDAESMLDQAVAFCGDHITEEGVLSIFGFPALETVHAFVSAVSDRDAAAALAILSGQAGAGKDLSRFMDEVTAHVRDLLVQGVASDSPARREQLLLLLDHFAEAEARMRWSPDKKLQFDVATIKAVHLLGQASLDEVLDALSAIRSGEPPAIPASRSSLSATQAPAPKPVPVQTSPPAPAILADAAEPSREKEVTSRSAAPSKAAPADVDASVAWERLAAEFSKTLIYRWMADGVFGGADAEGITILLPSGAFAKVPQLMRKKASSEAEGKLFQLLGRKTKVRFEASSTLPEPAESEPEQGELPPEADPAPSEPSKKEADPSAGFKDDPLIKKALELFKAELSGGAA